MPINGHPACDSVLSVPDNAEDNQPYCLRTTYLGRPRARLDFTDGWQCVGDFSSIGINRGIVISTCDSRAIYVELSLFSVAVSTQTKTASQVSG